MTAHEKELLLSTLEMLRNELQHTPDFMGYDWKDVDDYIFGRLDFTEGGLDELYAGTGKCIYTGSAIEGFRPICPTYMELAQLNRHLLATDGTLTCCSVEVPNEQMACIRIRYKDGYLGDIVLTEQDAPALTDYIGQQVSLDNSPLPAAQENFHFSIAGKPIFWLGKPEAVRILN